MGYWKRNTFYLAVMSTVLIPIFCSAITALSKNRPRPVQDNTAALVLCVSAGTARQEDFPVLKGPYLGQEAPVKKAEVFLDGIISTLDEPEMCAAFGPDGREFFYNRILNDKWAIYSTREINGRWTEPAPLFPDSGFTDRDFTISPDGQKIFFGSDRPRENGGRQLGSPDIFVTTRIGPGRWTEPKNLGPPINTDRSENYPSEARSGNLYYFTSRDDGWGGCDIYISRWQDGRYSSPENLGPEINSEKHDWDAVIAPDEDFIIFSSQDRADSIGKQDLYISFKTKDRGWTKAGNMGTAVNSTDDEICPSLSLDGRFLFFTSRRRGKADIFWISTSIIEKLKTEHKSVPGIGRQFKPDPDKPETKEKD